MKRILTSVIILLLTLSFISCSSVKSDTGFNIGDKAFNIAVEDLDGNETKLSDFKGKKVFLLAWTST